MFMTGDFLIDAMAFTRLVAGTDPQAVDSAYTLRQVIILARNIAPETQADALSLGSLKPWRTGTEAPVCQVCDAGTAELGVQRPPRVRGRWQGLLPEHPSRRGD